MSNVLSENGKREFSFEKGRDVTFPPLSVIVPIYNAEYTLDQAIRSLVEQRFDDIEIILVDDCSTDSSREIIDKWVKKDGRISVVTHKANAGYGAAMNDGLQVATGNWIGILEPDDYIYLNMYDEMFVCLAEHAYYSSVGKVIDIVKTPYIREVRDEGVIRGDKPKDILNCSYRHRIKPKMQPFKMTDPSASHLLRHHPSIWSAIYRKAFLDKNHIRFVEYPGAGWADNEFFYSTLLSAQGIIYIDEPFYVYREETDNEFKNFAKKNKSLCFERWHSMGDIIEKLKLDNNPDVMASHVSKGFTYLSGALQANGESDAVILSEMKKMFSRMPADIVVSESKISPYLKSLYYDFLKEQNKNDSNTISNANNNVSDAIVKTSKTAYYRGLIGEFGYAIRNNGIGFAMKQVKKVLLGK